MLSFRGYVFKTTQPLTETLKKVNGRWALVSRKTERPLAYYKGSGKPSADWVHNQERRVQYFKHRKAEAVEDEYRGQHTAPNNTNGAPLYDLTGGGRVYPDDVYSKKAIQYYGTGNSILDRYTFDVIHRAKDNPDTIISIYRAVPNDPEITAINSGDWVSINPQYAQDHGERTLHGNYKILTKKARASEIFTNGDSIHEWGYQGT